MEGGRELNDLREIVHGVENLRVVDWDDVMEKKKEKLNGLEIHGNFFDSKVEDLYLLYLELFGSWSVKSLGKVI